uniref:Uncharacterized protein n=1 Tax=Panagrolaimus sp. ES5 TaxID=591445 RepID=A0AC34F4G7_9BILA
MNEMNGYELVKRGKLVSDDENVIPLEESNKNFEIELLNGELKFQMCTNECYSGTVILCFDSDQPKTVPGSNKCDSSTQCEFRAGFSRENNKPLAKFFEKISPNPVAEGCYIVTVKSPKTKFVDVEDSSCYPKEYYDGKVVKIYVKQATPACFATIVNLDNRGELAFDDDKNKIDKVSDVPLEYELLHDALKFRMCTSECDNSIVILCFDSDEPKTVPGSNRCQSNQCEVQIGFSKDSAGKHKALFFKTFSNVKQATPDCFTRIIGAREWTPPTSTVPLITSTKLPTNAKESSISEETMWIIVAVVVVLLVIILACAGFWGYRYWKQKKTVTKSDGKKKLPDLKTSETTVVKQEKAIEETMEEKAKTTKDETVEEKKEVIQPKPKKAKHQNRDPKVVVKTPKKKTVEPTQEETPTNDKNVEPTVEDTNTNPSIIVQQRPKKCKRIFNIRRNNVDYCCCCCGIACNYFGLCRVLGISLLETKEDCNKI